MAKKSKRYYMCSVYHNSGKFVSQIKVDTNIDKINGRQIMGSFDADEYMKTYILTDDQYCLCR